jgi:hypothetical protein
VAWRRLSPQSECLVHICNLRFPLYVLLFVCLIRDLIFVATLANTFHTTILISYMGECEIFNPSVKF